MDQQQTRQCADRFITALQSIEQGDAAGIDRMVEMFAENAELTNPIIERSGGARAGRQRIAEFWQNYRATFGSIRSEFRDVTSSERSAALIWRSTGTHAGGSPLDYEGISLLEFDDDGRIARFKGYFDSRDVIARAPG